MEKEEISDVSLGYLILGTLRGAITLPQYPVKVREIEDVFDDQGQITHFVIVTESGLRYSVKVELLGATDG